MKEWQNYFMLTGTGAITLIGLLFVVITLGAERAEHGGAWLLKTYVTPTLVHFGGVFLIALLALSPEGDGPIQRFGLIGIAGAVYGLNVAVRVARNEGLFSDALLFHGAVPVVCYLGMIAAVTGAWIGVTSTRQVYFVLRVVSALLLLTGMRNAWAAATEVARRNKLK